MGLAPPGILSPLRMPFRHPSAIPEDTTARRDYSSGMLRRLAPAVTLLLLTALPVSAQIGLITVPRGSLRVDIAGAFYPNDEIWSHGTRLPLGTLLNGSSNPAFTALQSSLGSLLGQPVSGLSLGGITAIASREHGVGDLGFAYGLTPRITIFGNIPIVYTRSRITPTFDGTTSRVGINPSNQKLGTNSPQTNLFFAGFATALDTLKLRVQHSYYTGTAATLAQQTLTDATTMRAALNALIVDPASASPVLPTANDPYTIQLLARIAALQSTLNGSLALPAQFTGAPEFPANTLSASDFDNLLNEPTGLGLSSPNNVPHWGIGDMSAGVAIELARRSDGSRGTWTSAWARASGQFPNATAPNPGVLLDQGTGVRGKSVQIDGIVEHGTRTLGLRAEATIQHHFPANLQTRPTAPDNVLVPPAFLVAVTTQLGDSIAITARPWLTFAPHLSLSAVVQYWHRSASSTTYLTGQLPIANVDPTAIDIGSAANAFVVGLGFSYYHDGRSRRGAVSLPVEAGWSIERTVSSSAGIMPDNLTTRVSLRIYRPLIKQ